MDSRAINRGVIEQFRAGGPIEGMSRDRLLLLTTSGRRSGEPRTSPMMFHRQGAELYVVASNIGAPAHRDRYLNLATDLRVEVEIGDERYPATARPLDGDERAAVWATLTELYPFFVEHQASTDRTIPVLAIDRR